MLSLLATFLYDLISGKAYAIWHAHKVQEAINAQNTVASMSDAAVSNELLKFTRK